MAVVVVIIGAGQSGLATAACLTTLGIPRVVLERDDCIGSLWRKRSYDRVHLQLPKSYCTLPYAPHPPSTPTYFSKHHFIQYLDDYATKFSICPLFHREVECAEYDEGAKRWRVSAKNHETGELEEYKARFVVVASGVNDRVVVPQIEGMESFTGEVIHSSEYGCGGKYGGKAVLVVGCGNSGMEIAYDLACTGARTSIVVRRPFHVLTKEIWWLGMLLINFLPCRLVDAFLLSLCYIKFGDTSKYDIHRPNKGPLHQIANTPPTSPVLDVGTFKKIKSGEIQVLPPLKSVKGDTALFVNGNSYQFDAIILATGYQSKIKNWLKGNNCLIGDDGMAKQKSPNHWKGRNGLYCAGLTRQGISGAGDDALKIAEPGPPLDNGARMEPLGEQGETARVPKRGQLLKRRAHPAEIILNFRPESLIHKL